MYIFANRARASHRRCQLSSNVRRHNGPSLRSFPQEFIHPTVDECRATWAYSNASTPRTVEGTNMSVRSRVAVAILGLCALGVANAQGFPDGASTPSAEALKKRLGGNVFTVKLADGTSWRLEFKSNGYFFVDTSTGFRGSGEWTTEDGRLCSQLRGRDRSCNEARVHQDTLHFKRDSGEFIQYTPR